MTKSYKAFLQDITTFVFDVDGVLTDGTILLTSEGQQLRRMSIVDGYALKTAVDKGYHICIISGGSNPGVKERLNGLGVNDIYLGVRDKTEPFAEFLELHGVKKEQVVYMGDDVPDIPAMHMAVLPACPQNAVPEVKAISKYVSHKKGGEGCVRDIIEQVLKVRGDWYTNFDAKN